MKMINIKDKKIAEFNYKVLHNILPCNVNLVRWKKAENKKCMFCKEDEDIPHLLFNCMYAQTIWKKLKNDCNFNVSLEDIDLIIYLFFQTIAINMALVSQNIVLTRHGIYYIHWLHNNNI